MSEKIYAPLYPSILLLILQSNNKMGLSENISVKIKINENHFGKEYGYKYSFTNDRKVLTK